MIRTRSAAVAHRSGGLHTLTTAGASACALVWAFLLLTALVCTRWPPLQALDTGITVRMNEVVASRRDLVRAVQMVTDVGHGTGWWLLLSALALCVLLRGQLSLAVFVVTTAGGGAVLNRVVKHAVSRARPDVAEPVSQAGGSAFPSGHAMTSAIGVTILLVVVLPALSERVRRPLIGAAVAFVLAVGVSRVLLGVHWAGDVLGGWLLASAWLLTTVAALRRWVRAGPHQPAVRVRDAQVIRPHALDDPVLARASVRDLLR